MRKIKKAIEITDAKIQFVSLVDKAANKRRFLMRKAEEGRAAFTTYGRIIKADRKNHYVTGIVYEPMEEDSHGNYMTAEEITKAAYWFAKNGDKVDLQHSFEPLENAVIVENWVSKADFKIEGEDVKKGTWLMTVEVSDPKVWEDIEKGEITGFSMGGLGSYSEEDTEVDKVKKSDETEEDKTGLLSKLAKALGILQDKPVEKAGKSISGKNKETLQGIYDNLGAFLASFEDKEKDEVIIEENKEDCITMTKSEMESIITKSVSAVLKKAFEEDSEKEKTDKETDGKLKSDNVEKEGEVTVNLEELKKMIDEAVAAAMKSKEEQPTEEQIQKMVVSAVSKAVEPILKSRGLPSNLNDSGVRKAAKAHYLQGIL